MPLLQGGQGSRRPVVPEDCMAACDLAAPAGCDSFSYNPEQRRCFLKAGGGRQTCKAQETVCMSSRGNPYSCGTWQTYFKQGAGSGGASVVDLVPGAPPASPASSPARAPSGSSPASVWAALMSPSPTTRPVRTPLQAQVQVQAPPARVSLLDGPAGR